MVNAEVEVNQEEIEEEVYSDRSELSSEASHKYGVQRSRQMVSRWVYYDCFDAIFEYRREREEEERKVRFVQMEPLARHYIDKVDERL